MSQRVNLGKSAPNLYQTVASLDKQSTELLASSGFSTGFLHLLRVRISQINGCAYCLKLHGKDALSNGESSERIHVLPAWRETDYFDDKERAALTLVEAITQIADGQLPDATYEAAAAVLSAEQITAVEWLAIVMNAWNRIAISSRYRVAP